MPAKRRPSRRPSNARRGTRARITRPRDNQTTGISRSLAPTGPFMIGDHRLDGPMVEHLATPNCSPGSFVPRYIVFHYTAGRSARDSCTWLCNPEARASAHLVIGRDGSVAQLAPFNIKTWHAGISQWEGLTGLNSHAIGIEMDNAGWLRESGGRLLAWFGDAYSKTQAIQARHKLEQDQRWWHTYTDIQVQRALELAMLLVRHYELLDVVGHDDIAPDRKRDPGPAFPLEFIRARVIGRQQDKRERVRVIVGALNIRKGSGIEFEPAGPPLARGTEVFVLEKGARWTKVDVSDDTDLEGWVANRFLEAAPDQ